MLSSRSTHKLALVLLVFVFSLGLTACGLDEYADATNTALANFNSAGQAMNAQLIMINDDNSIISDPTWQEETLRVLDEYEAAGQAFASLPETPAGYEEVDALVTDLAFATTTLVDTARNMIETEDLSQLELIGQDMNTVNDLITQVDAAISAANQ